MPHEQCPKCGTDDPKCFFDGHETCADCELRQQGFDMDLAERDRQEDQPFVGPSTDGETIWLAKW